jgi:hypothetical protein
MRREGLITLRHCVVIITRYCAMIALALVVGYATGVFIEAPFRRYRRFLLSWLPKPPIDRFIPRTKIQHSNRFLGPDRAADVDRHGQELEAEFAGALEAAEG